MEIDCTGIENYFPCEYSSDPEFKEIIDECKEVVGPLLSMEGVNLDNIENEGYFSIDIYRLDYINEEFLKKVLDDSLNYFKYLGFAVHLLYKAFKESEAEESPGSQSVQPEFNLRRLWFECTGFKEIIPIASISPPHYGKFVTISGLVASISKVSETVYEATFKCDKCATIQYVLQPMGQLQTPKACQATNCNKGKGSSSLITFTRLKSCDIKVASQVITVIQTRYDSNSNEKCTDVIKVQLVNHLIEKCFIMDSVTVSGIIVEPKNSEEAGICKFYMLASSLSHKEEEKFSANILQGIQAIINEPDILSLIIASFCPSVSCNNMIKLGILLSLCGGHDSANEAEEESVDFRGQIHTLILGAPNKDKKELLAAAHLVAPISSFVDKNYTQNLVYDVKIGKGEETLDAGPILQANKGVSCIDDLDSMKTQWNSISEIMEAQIFQVAKKSFVKSVPIEIAMIATSTPAGGAYRAERTLYENIKMPTDMLNQFDLILHLVDEPDHESDRSFAKKVLKSCEGRSSGEASTSLIKPIRGSASQPRNDQSLAKRLCNIDKDSIDLLPDTLLSNYIKFIRAKISPIFEPEATAALFEFYESYKEKVFRGIGGPNVHPSDNQLLSSLMRLSIARARLEAKGIVTKREVLDIVELIKFTRTDIFPKDVLSLNSQSSLPLSFRRPVESSEGLSGLVVKRARSSNERFVRFLEDYFSENSESEFSLDDLWTIAKSGPPVAKFDQMVDFLNHHGYILQCGNSKYRWVARR